MKKFKIFVVALALVFMLASCSSAGDGQASAEESKKEVAQSPEVPASMEVKEEPKPVEQPVAAPPKAEEKSKYDISVEEQILVDDEKFFASIKSYYDEGYASGLKLLLENKSDEKVYFTLSETSLNGYSLPLGFYSLVDPGKKANQKIEFPQYLFKELGIEAVKDIAFRLHATSNNTWEDVLKTDVIKIETQGAEDYVQTYDDSGHLLYNGDFKIVLRRLEQGEQITDNYFGAVLYFYIENNADYNATVQIQSISFNGFMGNTYYGDEVAPGKKRLLSVGIEKSFFEDNDLEKIDEVELEFFITDTDNWEKQFVTPKASINLE